MDHSRAGWTRCAAACWAGRSDRFRCRIREFTARRPTTGAALVFSSSGMIALLPLLLLLQQPTQTVSPASGDTVGYWQQRADYRITAELDEKVETLHGKATLTYVNNSPDTLRQMYVYQLLNAFRPGSRWSAADEREGRVRFQKLKEPNYGFERFTSAPTVNGTPVTVEYPFAPDSTIARFELPAALAPGDSAIVEFAWDARPSATVYRRQGRRGRHDAAGGATGGRQGRTVPRTRRPPLWVGHRSRIQVRGRDVSRSHPDPRADHARAGEQAGAGEVREVQRARARVSREDLRRVRVPAAHWAHSPRAGRHRVSDDGDVRRSERGHGVARGGAHLQLRDAREQRVARGVDGRGAHELPERVAAAQNAAGLRPGRAAPAGDARCGVPRARARDDAVRARPHPALRRRPARPRRRAGTAVAHVSRVRDVPDGRVFARGHDVWHAPRHHRRQRVYGVSARLLREMEVQARGRAGDGGERGARVRARSRMVLRAVGAPHRARGLRADRRGDASRGKRVGDARASRAGGGIPSPDAGGCEDRERLDDRTRRRQARRAVGGDPDCGAPD